MSMIYDLTLGDTAMLSLSPASASASFDLPAPLIPQTAGFQDGQVAFREDVDHRVLVLLETVIQR